jgi:hypothetical protein
LEIPAKFGKKRKEKKKIVGHGGSNRGPGTQKPATAPSRAPGKIADVLNQKS